MHVRSFFAVLCTFVYLHIGAQEPSIYNQDFKGVKSVKFFTETTDSLGKRVDARKLIVEQFYDTSGLLIRALYYDNGEHVASSDWIYDSLGHVTMLIDWKKKDGNTKHIYKRETDSSGRFTIVYEYLKGEIVSTESTYWDSLSEHYVVRYWQGQSTHDAPFDQHEYNAKRQLVIDKSFNGFTEYRYDSLGTLNFMVMRQFENGQCSGYSPFHYEAVYSRGRLAQFSSKFSTVWFTYNEKGFIKMEKRHGKSENTIYFTTAEYVYY